MKNISYEESVKLTQDILCQPTGDWTHFLDGDPVREIARCIVGGKGNEKVFFRASDYCGVWLAEQFDRQSTAYIPHPEQMELDLFT